MKLTIINSNSSGNAYILENDQEALLIECGVRFERIKQALNFNLKKVVGCIVTHEHKDHCFAHEEVRKAGITLFASPGTLEAMGAVSYRAEELVPNKAVFIGKFHVMAFSVKHDCKQPVGFQINHDETGNILFLTDSYYCEYRFKDLNNIIIEANYCQTILDHRMSEGENPRFLRDRVIESHMSLATCKELLCANDLTSVNNIVLIHLSDNNSDAKRFKQEVQELTGKQVHVAAPGLVIENFNKQPY